MYDRYKSGNDFSRGKRTRDAYPSTYRPETTRDSHWGQSNASAPQRAPSKEGAVEERIVSLYRQGVSPDEIVRTVGRRRHMVIHTLHKAGLHLQPMEAIAAQMEAIAAQPAESSLEVEMAEVQREVQAEEARLVEVQAKETELGAVQTTEPRSVVTQAKKEAFPAPVVEFVPPRAAEPEVVKKPTAVRSDRWSQDILQAIEQMAKEELLPKEERIEAAALIEPIAVKQPPKPRTRRLVGARS